VGPIIFAAPAMTSIFMRAGGKRRRSAEVKARKNGNEFVQLETWLADFDLLFFAPE